MGKMSPFSLALFKQVMRLTAFFFSPVEIEKQTSWDKHVKREASGLEAVANDLNLCSPPTAVCLGLNTVCV